MKDDSKNPWILIVKYKNGYKGEQGYPTENLRDIAEARFWQDKNVDLVDHRDPK